MRVTRVYAGSCSLAAACMSVPSLRQVLVELVVVVVGEVLYHHEVYPREAFGTVRSFGVVCHAPRHPQVAEYLAGFAERVLRQAEGPHGVARVAVVVYNKETQAVGETVRVDLRELRLLGVHDWDGVYAGLRRCVLSLVGGLAEGPRVANPFYSLLVEAEALEASPHWVLWDEPAGTSTPAPQTVVPLQEVSTPSVRLGLEIRRAAHSV